METIDYIIFALFAISVVAIGLLKSRGEKDTSEDYFLAGRGLTWPLIGFSLIAANISAEQMVGMSGAAANGEIGFAIASYEWMAAITLVGVGFFFLPTFLKTGIYTIPQFLETRFTPAARTLMSIIVVFVIVSVNISVVTYLGAKFLEPYVQGSLGANSVAILSGIIALIAAVYVAAGGLKACAWADLIQGAALILGGAVITYLAIDALADPDPEKYTGINSFDQITANLGGVSAEAPVGEKLGQLKEDHMHMILPASNKVLPYTALLLGLWIPNFYYWGLNQYIMQRTLGAKSLAEGQKGIVFAAGLKIVIPFVVCVPGIIAFTLYSGEMGRRFDETANAEPLAAWQEVVSGTAEQTTLFAFNDDFALRDPATAQAMFAHNLALSTADSAVLLGEARFSDVAAETLVIDEADGEPLDEGEVLAAANALAIDAAQEATAEDLPVTSEIRGYNYDEAFPILVSLLAPAGLKGFVIAAVMGAVVSSLASMYNAASTIFSMDVFRRVKKDATQHQLVLIGRICVPIAAGVGAVLAPFIQRYESGAFTFIQEGQGFIFPTLGVFLYGIFAKRAPKISGIVGVSLSVIVYGALLYPAYFMEFAPGTFGALILDPFLNRIAITFLVIALVLGFLRITKPLPEPFVMPSDGKMELVESKPAKFLAVLIVIAVVALYIVFW